MVDGSHKGPTLPGFMDPHGMHGDLVVLKMEAVSGKLPVHPFMIRKSVETWINGKIDGAFPENQGITYALKVRSKWQLERLLKMTELSDRTQIKITKHVNHNTTRCVISCKDMVKIEDDDAMKYLSEQHVTDIRRITRRSANGKDLENTPTVILTINGTKVPEYVDVGYLRCKTRPYYPSPMLCYKCYSFGHTKVRCQQPQPTCGNCAKQHVLADGERCTEPMQCTRCKSSEHAISSRRCPVYQREDAIQHIRVDKGITYPAARRLFEATNNPRSYAGIANASKDQAIADLTAKYDTLAHQMKTQMMEKDKTIEELKEKLNAGTSSDKNTDYQELRKMVLELRAEIQQKDQRIMALEASQVPSDRLDLTRKNGTIEDLVKRVQSLEDASAAKDRENEALRAENQALREQIEKIRLLPQPTITTADPAQTRKTTNSQRPRKQALCKQQTKLEQQEKPHPSAPYTGTIKKTVSQQSSTETDPKRVKPGSPLRISDSDEEMIQDVPVTSDVANSSSEEGGEQQETEMEP